MAASVTPVGIDLGTTRTVVATVDSRNVPQTVRNADGDATTPSAILIEGRNVTVGKEAIKAVATDPELVARFVKREMGNRQYSFNSGVKKYPAEMLQSFILRRVASDAAAALARPVRDVVITVPAFFNEPKRQATIDAGMLADLNVLAIVNEPTAAAIAYGHSAGQLDHTGGFKTAQKVLVYDLGGGTFDVSLLSIRRREFETLAIDGNARLGGLDWDLCVAEWLAEQFQSVCGLRMDATHPAYPELLTEAEELKHALSVRPKVPVRIKVDSNVLKTELTREQFDDLTAHLLDRTRFTIRKLLEDAKQKWSDIDRVLLVGGSTRMPQVVRMLRELSGAQIDQTVSPDEAVAHGAAIYARSQIPESRRSPADAPELSVTDVTAHPLGVLGKDLQTGRPRGKVIIEKNTPLPAERSARFPTVQDGQANVVIRVIEGGDIRGLHATPIGIFRVEDLPPGLPAGSPIDVTLKYTDDGIIEAFARVLKTGQSARIRIERQGGLSDQEKVNWKSEADDLLQSLGLG